MVLTSLLLLAGCATDGSRSRAEEASGPATGFEFALIGDVPYDESQATN